MACAVDSQDNLIVAGYSPGDITESSTSTTTPSSNADTDHLVMKFNNDGEKVILRAGLFHLSHGTDCTSGCALPYPLLDERRGQPGSECAAPFGIYLAFAVVGSEEDVLLSSFWWDYRMNKQHERLIPAKIDQGAGTTWRRLSVVGMREPPANPLRPVPCFYSQMVEHSSGHGATEQPWTIDYTP